jgi:hypothetical protein
VVCGHSRRRITQVGASSFTNPPTTTNQPIPRRYRHRINPSTPRSARLPTNKIRELQRTHSCVRYPCEIHDLTRSEPVHSSSWIRELCRISKHERSSSEIRECNQRSAFVQKMGLSDRSAPIHSRLSPMMVMSTIVPVSGPNVEVHARSIAVIAVMVPVVPVLPIPAVHLLNGFSFACGPEAIKRTHGRSLRGQRGEPERSNTSGREQPVSTLHSSFSLRFAGI